MRQQASINPQAQRGAAIITKVGGVLLEKPARHRWGIGPTVTQEGAAEVVQCNVLWLQVWMFPTTLQGRGDIGQEIWENARIKREWEA